MTSKISEYQIQCEFVEKLEEYQKKGLIDLFSSIPNSTFTTSWKQKTKNRNSGLRAGLPDLFVLVKGKGYWIEMKTETGTLQDSQKEWIKKLNSNGYLQAFIACSLQEGELIISDLVNQVESKNSKYLQANLKGAKMLKKLCL